jgi:hypothetical protein
LSINVTVNLEREDLSELACVYIRGREPGFVRVRSRPRVIVLAGENLAG